MKSLVIITSTRAEYGLLSPIIKKFKKRDKINTFVAVTGTHLSPEFGMTVNEIVADGVDIDTRIDIHLTCDTSVGISKSMALAIAGFAEYFAERKPDAIMILGDRFETLAIAIAAMNERIPIIHIHGGEATEGAIDEAVRNALTKMSYLHFPSTEPYRSRIIQMGEAPERVFNVGAVGVENALGVEKLSKSELENSLNCKLNKFAVMTFHPVTLENNTAQNQAIGLLDAMAAFPEITFICTKANADMNGRVINECIKDYAQRYENILLFDSLGMQKYLSALSYADFVIGNSSSGIIEAPSFHIPTINIGDRQKGRIQAESVINCEPTKDSIVNAINKAISQQFRKSIKDADNPYGNGGTSDRIVKISEDFIINNKIDIKKSFYELH